MSAAAWIVAAVYRPRLPPTPETITVDTATFREALELLGDAWEIRGYYRFARTLAYVANVDALPFELGTWLAGREAWQALPAGP